MPVVQSRVDGLSADMAKLAADELAWMSADDSMVANRKCKKELPSLDEIEAYLIQRNGQKARLSGKVSNVTILDESPEFMEAFKRLTSKIDIFGQVESYSDVEKKYKIGPECAKVKCAVEKIFGKELGNKLLYLNLRYGFNGSEMAFDATSRLNISEIDSLISAVEAYPSSRFPINRNQQLSKFRRGDRLPMHNSETLAFATISFYDNWSTKSAQEREYVAFHELAHNIGNELNLDEDENWLKMSGWIQKGEKWQAAKTNFSSEYGATNPHEDFAEAVSAYRYNPSMLKKMSPEKYQFIKETVFDGLEYLSSTQCSMSNSFSHKLLGQISSMPRLKIGHQELIKNCGEEARDFFLEREKVENKLRACLAEAKQTKLMLAGVDALRPRLKYSHLLKSSIAIQRPAVGPNSPLGADNFKETKAQLRSQLIEDVLTWDQKHSYNYTLKNGSNLCHETWSQYGYQAIFANDKELGKAVNTHSRREDFNKYLISVCQKAQQGKKTPTPLTRAEIERAIAEFP